MASLQHLDVLFLHFLNQSLANPWFDAVIPFASGNALFYPVLLASAVFVIWRWGKRGWAFVLLAVLATLAASNLVCEPLKEWIGRPRPAVYLPGVRLLTGNGAGMGAMPSSHAANWGALVVVAWMFWRPSWRFMAPLAVLVGFSRVYVGVHHPSDVLAGFVLGGFTAWVLVKAVEGVWLMLGRAWFPALWARCPSLFREREEATARLHPLASARSWRNGAWLLIALLLWWRLLYIASGAIELSEDEAYQWMWSQRLDWAYYSKPPLIAWLQWLGTSLWGDTAFGVRFMAPVLSAASSLMLWSFIRRRTDERTAFWSVAIFAVTPLFAVGSILLTVDVPTVFFHTAAALAFWKAMEKDHTGWWLLGGLCAALGFLSKFFSPFLWLGLALFLMFNRSYRHHLRRPGPWLALGCNALALLPVVFWNVRHGWITMTHLRERGGLDGSAHFNPALFSEFAGAVCGLLNPVFVLAALLALWGWLRMKDKPALLSFLFCCSVPVFLTYLALSLQAKAQPNWIAPVAPLLFLPGLFWWHGRARLASRLPVRWLAAGFAIGLPAVVFMHDTDLLKKAFRVKLGAKSDPLNRVRGGSDLARVVEEQRQKLEAAAGGPVFVIADHYGRASLLNFYHPAARSLLPGGQLAYVLSSEKPQNQYWFWPSYEFRSGQNAIFVRQSSTERKAPGRLRQEFARVENLGLFKVRHQGRVCRKVQLYACYDKLPKTEAKPDPDTAGLTQARTR